MEANISLAEAVDDFKLTTFFSRKNEIIMGISFILLSIIGKNLIKLVNDPNLIILNFTGVIGNTYTILVMIFRKRLYNCCTPYLISVSISDLIMTAIILPVAGFNAVLGVSYIPIFLCKSISTFFHILLGKFNFFFKRERQLAFSLTFNYVP